MNLKDWLAEARLTHTEFAQRIGRTPEAVRRYVGGERIPDKATMPLIVEHTAGSVTANDFFGIAANPALCGTCQLTVTDPAVRACTDTSCPLAHPKGAAEEREAA